MDFESWWEKTNAGKPYPQKIKILAKSFAREAWQASRENMQDVQAIEFCRGMDCPELTDNECAYHQNWCQHGIKEFQSWLRDNGYRIVKD